MTWTTSSGRRIPFASAIAFRNAGPEAGEKSEGWKIGRAIVASSDEVFGLVTWGASALPTSETVQNRALDEDDGTRLAMRARLT